MTTKSQTVIISSTNMVDVDPGVAYVLLTCGIVILICVVLGLIRLCCKSSSGSTRVAYPVAISNRLFNEWLHAVLAPICHPP